MNVLEKSRIWMRDTRKEGSYEWLKQEKAAREKRIHKQLPNHKDPTKCKCFLQHSLCISLNMGNSARRKSKELRNYFSAFT